MRFTFRVTCILACIILFSVALNGLLSSYSFQKSYKELTGSRFAVIGKSIKRSIDYGLGIGLDIEANGNLQAVIDRALEHTPEILSIAIVNERGEAVFHTDRERIGQPVLTKWLHGLHFPKGAVWAHESDDGMAFSLYNNFDVYVGALDITYDQAAMRALFGEAALRFELSGIAVTAGALALAFLSITLIARRVQQSLHWYEGSLARVLGEGKALPGESPKGTLYGAEFDVYLTKSREVMDELEARHAAIRAEPEPPGA